MNIFVKNIGKLKEAKLDLCGITVIAGENDTGKSTIGKALFAIMNGLYDVENRVMCERVEAISHALEQYCTFHGTSSTKFYQQFTIDMISLWEKVDGERKNYLDGAKEYLSAINSDKIQCKDMDKMAAISYDLVSITTEKLQRVLLKKVLSYEFDGQFSNIFAEEKGGICLSSSEGECSLVTEDNSVLFCHDSLDGRKMVEALYIDDPFVLNQLHFTDSGVKDKGIMHHREHLSRKLRSEKKTNNIVTELYTETKLSHILTQLNRVCQGELKENKNEQSYLYQADSKREGITVGNLSAGLKTFVILKTLLLNGSLNHGGTIIFDEPEIHLHPEWQLIFADLIVLIQKEFDLRIVLTTHSPYFLEAIEVYTQKHGIADKCKFYLTELEGNTSTIREVTHHLEEIYHLLAKPIQTLEDESNYDD